MQRKRGKRERRKKEEMNELRSIRKSKEEKNGRVKKAEVNDNVKVKKRLIKRKQSRNTKIYNKSSGGGCTG